MKALVVYYSLTGKTETVANTIAEKLNADVRKIEEAKPRKNIVSLYVSGGYAASHDKCGEIKPCDLDFDGYDLIMIGTPNWANKPVPAINAFISKVDFKSKMVVLFCTMIGEKRSQALFSNFKSKVEAKSGKVVGTFPVNIQGVTDLELIEETENAIRYLPTEKSDDVVSEKPVLARS